MVASNRAWSCTLGQCVPSQASPGMFMHAPTLFPARLRYQHWPQPCQGQVERASHQLALAHIRSSRYIIIKGVSVCTRLSGQQNVILLEGKDRVVTVAKMPILLAAQNCGLEGHKDRRSTACLRNETDSGPFTG